MWTYRQASGVLFHDDKIVATGYSGTGPGKNNPARQEEHNVGPIPQGKFSIGDPYDTDSHGPHVMRLTPAVEDEMFGRAGFLIHGDSIAHPGTASHGCIILPRDVRNQIADSDDRDLTVTV